MKAAKKYEIVITYICRLATKKEKLLNRTKLVKTIWLADILNYMKFGKTITGDNIIRMDHGPVNQNALPGIQSAMSKGAIKCSVVPRFYITEYLYSSDIDAELDVLLAHEVDAIHEALDVIIDMTATEISEFTHKFDAWKNHQDKEVVKPIEFLMSETAFDESDDEFEKENAHLFA